jgi:hypothetical protein
MRSIRTRVLTVVVAAFVGLVCVRLQAAALSREKADLFSRKMEQLTTTRPGSLPVRRIAITEEELNSWLAYGGKGALPAGIAEPQVTLLPDGKVVGEAVVDLASVGKSRGSLDLFRILGGRVPLNISGVLKTAGGTGRFQLASAEVSGIPVPETLLQELISYYSKTTERPDGVRLDQSFPLPASIKQIDVGLGEAVVIQ